MFDSCSSSLRIVGGAGALYLVYRVLDFIAFYCFVPSQPLKTYKRKKPDHAWALVTGSSAGLGLGIATELAKQGFGLILLGHNDTELSAEKQRLETSVAGAAVRKIVMDVQKATNEDIIALVKDLESLTITILVNNVGGNPVVPPPTRDLESYSLKDVENVLNLNLRFMARLTTALLPVLGRKPKVSGQQTLILNVSSGSYIGMPWVVLYAATKAFNRSFSHGLSRELEQSEATKHVKCLTVVPGDMLSQANSVGVHDDAPKASDYGRYVVQTVDAAIKRGQRDVVPHWKHALQIMALGVVPDGMLTQGITQVMKEKKAAWEEHHAKSR